MNAKVGLTAAVILIVVGLITAAYSSTHLSGQTILFNQNSVQIDSHSYVGYELVVNLDGKYQPEIKGGVGSVGCCVDFYLVTDANWNSWSTSPAMRGTLSTVHLNSSAVSSQSLQGQFTFVPSTQQGYNVVFVNDEYPNDSGVQIVDATITLQYVPLSSVYALIAGLAVFACGLATLVVALRNGKKLLPPS